MNARKVYYLLSGVRAFLLYVVFTVNAIYFIKEAGLNPFQLVLVGTMMEVSIMLFEVPTGFIADRVSRKASVVIGMFIVGAAHLLEGAIPSFWAIALAYGIWGLGYTFFSGAEEAWIADEEKGEGLQKLFLTGSQFASLGNFAGIFASVALSFLFSVQTAILLAGGAFLVFGIWLAIFMPEHHFEKMERNDTSPFHQFAAVVKSGYQTVRGSTILFAMAGISLMWGLASEGFDRLWEIHLIQGLKLTESSAVLWFGIINAVAFLLHIAVVQGIQRRGEELREQQLIGLLGAMNILLVLSMMVFALAGQFWLAIASYWSCALLRGLNHPLYSIWLNQKLESKGRATMLSLFGQLDAIGQIAGGPVVGLIALSSVSLGLITTSLLTIPVLFFLWMARRQQKKALHLKQSAG
ncbi:MFS transporter [Metabacillus sp. GX 13764]|uniref:MFS transporter n=1 Tax=Metabacillus kandeliae TaxID=2900151 RepID=UPI001E5769CB|nr:MFS transporter [Metabacillus kandeliae]MCD7034374.1 MFS transporter [Metabacillus kandeliae]